MEAENKTILSVENFKKMNEWLSNDNVPEPEFAISFMTTLHLKYMYKKGSPLEIKRKRTPINIDALPSLKRLMNSIHDSSNKTTVKPLAANEEDKKQEIKITETLPKATSENLFFNEKDKEKDEEIKLPELCSSVIGNAIRHCARLHDINVSVSHIQIIMYVIYGYRLTDNKEDIFKENPRMWRYGPVFPSSFNKIKKTNDVKFDHLCWTAVNRYDLKLGTDIINLVAALSQQNITELAKNYTGPGTPWNECQKCNPEKWNTIIPDDLTKKWFENKKNNH